MDMSSNNAKKVQKEDAGWHGSHKGEACLMVKDFVNLKSRHFPDIRCSFSINSPTQMTALTSGFFFFSIDVLILSDDSLPAITSQKS